MLVSKALYLTTIIFAVFSIYCTFSGYYLTTVKFSQTSQSNLLQPTSQQWFEPKARVIMLLVDSLRFDYLAQDSASKFKQNKFKKFSNLFKTSPNETVLLRAKSEAPTLTIERLPCLLTGNIPPKANIIQAFGALPISEDNILKQLSNAKKKIYFSGDPLWTQMFPHEFTEAITVPGFDMMDMDVDNPTTAFIQTKLKENNYDLIIGHMLGIDHMGHSYGLADERVAQVIAKIDEFLMNIIEKMDNDTMLIVLGDHGMTEKGEHGRGSLSELDTTIAAYYKRGFKKYQEDNLKDIMKAFQENRLPIKQVDLVPTLSMLMGVPIPFSNLGQIINDLDPKTTQELLNCSHPAHGKEILQNNYLNSLQIIKYFNEYQDETRLFNSQEVLNFKNLEEKTRSTYQVAINMVDNQTQCEESFNKILTETILNSQKLSDEVYRMISNKGSYDLSLIYQGTILLLLVLATYVLIIQFLYRHGSGESSIILSLQNTALAFKKATPVLVVLLIVALITWYFKKRIIHPITSSFLCAGIWLFSVFCGFLFQKGQVSLKDDSPMPAEVRIQLHQAHIASQEKELHSALQKQKSKKDLTSAAPQENEPEKLELPYPSTKLPFDQIPLFNKEGQNNSQILQSSTLFLFKTPGYSIIAVIAIILCIVLSHRSRYQDLDYTQPEPSALGITLILFTLRLTTLLAHKVYLQVACTLLFIALELAMVFTLSLAKIRVILGLLLVSDWIWHEIKYLVDKLQAKKILGYLHLACFATLAICQLIDNRETYVAQTLIPRVVWTFLIGIIIYSWKFESNAKIIKRNLQLCLFQFLLLLQAPSQVFVFGFLMTVMRVTTHVFRKANILNFLYPLVLAIESHLGIFLLGHNDRWIPGKFTAGFIGLHDFNFILSPLMVFLNIMTSYVLGLLTISRRSNAYSKIIKKRNVIIFVLLFNVVYFGAVVKAYVNLGFYFNESIEKFMIDATLYIFTMVCGYFIL